MCDELIIPNDYHSFYKSLRVTEAEQLNVEMDEAEEVSVKKRRPSAQKKTTKY